MSAPNFSCRSNSQYIYAFCEPSEFDEYVEENKELWGIETEEELEDAKQNSELYSDWYDEEKDYYLNWLEEELNKMTADGTGLYSDFTESTRIIDGDEVAEVRKYIQFAGGEFMVMASIDFEAGYYAGFALDWNVKKVEGTRSWYSSFDYMPDARDCAEMLREETDLNEGLCKALAPKLQARLEAAMDEVTEAIEKALQTVSPYHLTGVCASNGEGFYTNHKEKAA